MFAGGFISKRYEIPLTRVATFLNENAMPVGFLEVLNIDCKCRRKPHIPGH